MVVFPNFFEPNALLRRLYSVMKKLILSLLSAAALLVATSGTGRADEFSDIANSPYTYWVPAPGYATAPPPYYYGPAPVRVYVGGPHFFFGFHFH
jgi:hypothetical protein